MGSRGKNALRPWWRLAEGAGEPGADPTLPLTTASSHLPLHPAAGLERDGEKGGGFWHGMVAAGLEETFFVLRLRWAHSHPQLP